MSAAKSVVLSCAGTGSRLGLAQTKALIKIKEKSIIAWQLEALKNINDLRIVIGFQANDVIQEVLRYRRNVTFVYNHSYFDTKTGMSLYLGGKDAVNPLVIGWDGDLLVHPDDVNKLLEYDGEYLAYSEKSSADAVFLNLNQMGQVTSFSREAGDFEWTGPCCLRRDKLRENNGHVFDIFVSELPIQGLQIRAKDLDTYEDYLNVIKFVENW